MVQLCPLDFRSDTVTRPTHGMRRAMAEAEVGDDVLGDDPTVERLQCRVAELLGKEAALLVPSGTMSNLIAVRVHCRGGDELICEEGSHIYNYEQSGYAQICGVAARPVRGQRGILRLEQLRELIRPDNPHQARTRLVTLENTHNRGGGSIQPFEVVAEICDWAARHSLRRHLDGARLWNAAIATGMEPSRWAAMFDTVSVCFSKGLGAPAGSALAGPRELIAEAVRHRKVLGGAMRQSGVLAAAALYALDHHVARLAEDHANARRLAEGLRGIEGVGAIAEPIETNMVFFQIDARWHSAARLCEALAREGVLVLPTAERTIRAVTHLDVGPAEVDRAIAILGRVVPRGPSAACPAAAAP